MSELSHLKNKLLVEQIEEQIFRYILDTPIDLGQKLPNEFELAQQLRAAGLDMPDDCISEEECAQALASLLA